MLAREECVRLSEVWVLIDAIPGRQKEVSATLANFALVHDQHTVHYGHFDFLVKVDGANHAEVQSFIASKLRFLPGIEAVREIGDDELPSVLASEA